jgi:hypothetical protein
MEFVAGSVPAALDKLQQPDTEEVAREFVEKKTTPSVPAVIFRAGARVAESGIARNSVEVRYPRVLVGTSLSPM